VPEDNSMIEIDCEHVILQISSYIEGEVDADLRARIEAHVRGCKHCTAILDGTTNTLRLLADGKAFELPAGFSERLRLRLAAHIET
jgi:anti-sigma factor RsiW